MGISIPRKEKGRGLKILYQEKTMEEDIKKFLGLPPYNNCCNIVQNDGFYYMSLCAKYGKEKVDEKIKNFSKTY